MKRIRSHFSKVAHIYDDLRTTDPEPILLIRKKLEHLSRIEAADVGCGGGRYDVRLFEQLGEKLCLTCIDDSENMLKELAKKLQKHKMTNYKTMRTQARVLPLKDNSLDAVITLNALHHFIVLDFLEEASRVLRDERYLFIYTRLRSQNRESIWGRFFPQFHEKEKRLYELSELKAILKTIPALKLKSTNHFRYKRTAKLKTLINQAKHHHYSTFYLYDQQDFEEALRRFEANVIRHFKDPDNIVWHDENIMLTIRRKARPQAS
ncbi:MAG: class I SAM-dependent methyltransferase [Candidatus Zixiibacteriota bacterium]|nr:MAG: class I SAM-dependent methyltransferase [candidate division Zixibacteria bacterium]